jgi:hypothetical protein
MKFETARVRETIQTLEDARFAGPKGETPLANWVSNRFQQMGWQVEWREVVGSRFPQIAVPWLGWMGLGVWMTLGTVLTFQGSGTTPRLLPLLVGVLWFVITAQYGFRFGWGWPPRRSTPLLIARREAAAAAPVRVVVQTPLGPVTPVQARTPWWVSTPLVAFLVLGLWLSAQQGVDKTGSWSRWGAGLALGWLWLAVVARAWREIRSARPAGFLGPEDRTGLSTLLELARTWPPARSQRIEIVWVAAGGQTLDFAGARAVVRMLRTEGPMKPTLLILFFAPGIGLELRVVTRRHHKLAHDAATGLWIPHRSVTTPEALLPFWPLERRFPDHLALVGAEWAEHPQPEVDPEALQRTAQLATEITLRWAKQETR